jgi:hypothetical protein
MGYAKLPTEVSREPSPMFESDAALFLSKLLPVFAYPLGLTILLGLLSGTCALLRYRRLAGSQRGHGSRGALGLLNAGGCQLGLRHTRTTIPAKADGRDP